MAVRPWGEMAPTVKRRREAGDSEGDHAALLHHGGGGALVRDRDRSALHLAQEIAPRRSGRVPSAFTMRHDAEWKRNNLLISGEKLLLCPFRALANKCSLDQANNSLHAFRVFFIEQLRVMKITIIANKSPNEPLRNSWHRVLLNDPDLCSPGAKRMLLERAAPFNPHSVLHI